MDVFQGLLGPQRVWELTITRDENGVLMPRISRTDGKFFDIRLETEGYDRPVITNYGIGNTAVVFDKNGCIATEPEVTKYIDGSTVTQNRVIRASADNPNYGGLPKGTVSGRNMLDTQRVRYRDGAVVSTLAAADFPPTRKTQDGFVPCKMVPLIGMENYDAPGKAALMDAILTLLTEEELAALGRKLYRRAAKKSK
ncbi:MAG: hypothetical protein KIH89_004510 [Candidatus Shapirobacteria bacterium]|nr:hypothetical protein [Candidatus Shapirobacteria bacterium]